MRREYMSSVNREYKDRIFCMIFGYEKYKKNLLDLFNALNGTNYTREEDLEINTLDNAIYMSMRNDVSCIIDSNMALFEQQSTWNPNMPLRGFLYCGSLYNKYIKQHKLDIYNRKLIKLPTPQYYVLYNGTEKKDEVIELKLSDAFAHTVDKGEFEWTAKVININTGNNNSLISKCKVLKGYVILTTRMREYISKYSSKDFSEEEAVKMAVDECINEDVLREFLLENKAEVVKMFLTEYNEKQTLENMYNDGVEVGKEKGIEIGKAQGIEMGKVQGIEFGERKKLVEMVYKKIKKGKTVEEIADDLEENIEVVKQICGNINAVGINKNLEVIIEQLTMK